MMTRTKKKIAVDIDEVLAEFIPSYLQFYNLRNGTNFNIQDIFSFNLWESLGIEREEAVKIVFEFYGSDFFKRIKPIPFSVEAISKLSEKNHPSIITSRPESVREETIEWTHKYFPGMFREFHFTNQFSNNGAKKNKSDFCIENGYSLLIEDNASYANECARRGIDVFLMEQPWNRKTLHPKIVRVRNWNEIQRRLP